MPPPAADADDRVQLDACQTDDVDAQALALHGWCQRYQQLSAGRFRGETLQGRLGAGIVVLRESTNRRLAQLCAPPAGHLTFATMASRHGVPLLDGVPVTGDSVAAIRGDDTFSLSLPEDTRIVAVTLPAPLLQSRAEWLAEALDARAARRQPQRDHGGPARVLRSARAPAFAAFLEQALSSFASGSRVLAQPAALDALRDAALAHVEQTLADAAPGHRAGAARSPGATDAGARRLRLVERARTLIDARLGDDIGVAALCGALGVSRRTLQYGFEQVLGVGPNAYLRAVRLNAARRDLKAADGSAVTVSEIAARRGFWHLGHFSADYRRMFGERPSDTLAARLVQARALPGRALRLPERATR